MDEELSLRGDKLRKALLAVWLANKYEKNFKIADLRRISGYTSSGIYTAKESGWFTENENGDIKLTDKAELYLEKNILDSHNTARQLLLYLFIMFTIMLIQNILYYNYKYLMIFNRITSLLAAVTMFSFYILWHRLNWLIMKRQKK